MAGKPNKAGKSGKPSPAGKRGGRRPASAQQHPGEVLREILADTPPALAAKWFGLSATELEAFYNGELPLTPAMAETAGSIFGTGAAPWLDMMAAWDEAHATEKAAQTQAFPPQSLNARRPRALTPAAFSHTGAKI